MMESKLYNMMVSASRINKVNNENPTPVSHKVPQGMKLNVTVNIKGARNIGDLIKPRPEKKCTSRLGAPKTPGKLVDLPDSLIDKLHKSDKKVMEWVKSPVSSF